MRLAVARLLAAAAMVFAGPALADPLPARFEDALAAARGQTVYFNAWGGNERINAYIAWAGDRVKALYGVELRHVKLADTAEAVTRVLAEKAAGRDDAGSVDLIWINGENFSAMKQAGLLAGPFVHLLPNFRLVDTEGKPTTTVDFTVPVEGLEAPWGMAQLVFLYDTARITEPPRRMAEFPAWAAANPGRFTYPAPPDFTGTTFLKQVLHATIGDASVLRRAPAPGEARILSKPLWDFLDALHPHLWRAGRSFPRSDQHLRQLLDDGEIDIAFSFNPGEASSAIAQGLLPATVRTYVLDGGTIANTHFLAIPFNANAKAGAVAVADFLLSPEAQARKQDPRIWGDPTVLAIDKLPAAARALFDGLPLGVATLTPLELGPVLPEPHPGWMTEIESLWRQRYGS
jgi:putative thiamine transport system substrate-binding protein